MKQLSETSRRTVAFYTMVSPWLIVFITLGLFPLLYGLYLSFTNYYGFNMDALRFTGLHNYRQVFTDSMAMRALGRTLLFTAINVPISTSVALFLAILLNNNVKGGGVFRTIFYLPSIIPIITTILMWRQLLYSRNGILNKFMDLFGADPVNWLGYDFATFSLILMMSWGAGGGIIIFLAGLKGIPQDLYEAASIDGASTFHKFRKITVPLMTPVIFFNVIMGIIGSLQVYMQPILLSGGGTAELLNRPIEPNYFYVVHAFQQIFSSQRFAYGMALLWVLFVVIMVLSVTVFTTSKYWVYYETDQE